MEQTFFRLGNSSARGLNMENPMKVWQIQHDREGSA
jgi:hypothetical protein